MRKKIIELCKEYFTKNIKKENLISGKDFLSNSGKLIDEEDLAHVIDSVLDCWFTEGRFNKKFENEIKKYLGVRHCLTVNSGSSANLVAISTLCSDQMGDKALRAGDQVITVAAGFPTTVNPIIQNGLVPVFIDVDLYSLNIDVSLIESAITSKTRAIMIAHTLGNPFDLEEIRAICDKYNLFLIEDCCDALGSKYNGKMVGTFGDIATLSFYPAHQITTGEGGLVYMNNLKIYKIAKSIRDWGRDCWCPTGVDNTCKKRFGWNLGSLPKGFDHKFTYSNLGYNLKITDMQAALGYSQIKKIETFVRKRRENFDRLKDNLSSCNKIRFLKVSEKSEPSFFGFPIFVDDDVDREEMQRFLNDNKIGTRNVFAGNVIRQPYFNKERFNYVVPSSLENTDKIMKNVFWVGVHPSLSFENIDYISSKIKEFIGEK